MIAPARAAAFRVLQRVRAGATLADATVRERDALREPRDRALAHELASGVLRWRAALDYRLAAVSSRPLEALDADVLDILRLAAYQVIHLDRLPDHAVVHDAVELARAARHASATGFVNGVLRSLLRTRAAAVLPARPPDGARSDAARAYLAITQSHPAWLADRWLARHGFAAAAAWVEFDNQPPPLTLRVNQRITTRADLVSRLANEGIEAAPTRWASHGLVVASGRPLESAAFREGLFLVQDEASQLVGELARAVATGTALDACASPGGKTLALAEAAGTDRRLVVAADRRPRRLRLLRDTLARTGLARDVRVVQLDAARGMPFGPVFDLVLVDAPCSGLGTIRREPDLKWRRRPEDLDAMAAQQRRMLRTAARAVAPGGRLLYATCSSEPEENEAVADWFIAEHAGFSPHRSIPGSEALRSLMPGPGRLQTWPFAHGLEAFFAAVFRRDSGRNDS